MPLKARRLKGLQMDEVSGVDAPAHLAPGYLVMKAAGDPVADLNDEQLEELTKAFLAEEEEPVETTTQALIKVLAAHNEAEAQRQRWSTITPDVVDRLIKEAIDPVTRMNKALDEVQKAAPDVCRATAFLQVAESDPELFAAYEARLNEPPEPVEKAEPDPSWAALEAKADEIQKAAPSLTRPEAIVRAADLNPDLALAVSGG